MPTAFPGAPIGVPSKSPLFRLRSHLPMFAGVVLSVFAAGSIGLWASNAPDLPGSSDGVGEVATTQDVQGTPAPPPTLLPVPAPAAPVTPSSGPYTYPKNNVPLVTPNRSAGTPPTSTPRVPPTPVVLPTSDSVTTPRLRLSGF